MLFIMLEFPSHVLELVLHFKTLLTMCCLLIGETLHHLKCFFALFHLFHLRIIIQGSTSFATFLHVEFSHCKYSLLPT